MRYQENLHIVRGSQKYIGAQDKNLRVPYTLESTNRTLIEGERNLVLNLADQYIREREESYLYRLYGKINVLYDNVISGCSYDPLFVSNHLYYDPIIPSASTAACGYPSSSFFDFIPYTALTSAHNFQEIKARKDNWVIYESYIDSSVSDHPMEYTVSSKDDSGTVSYSGLTYQSGDGVPFFVENVKIQGKSGVKFICPVNHGLNEGEYVVLQTSPSIATIGGVSLVTTVNGKTTLSVFSLGDETLGSEEKVFTVLLQDSTITVTNNDFGVFKRLIDPSNVSETLSSYYVHSHKILTKPTDDVLDRTGFEFGIFF